MRIRTVFIVSTLALAAPLPAFADCPPGSIPVYVVAGQSNAVGFGEVSALPPEYRYLAQTHPNVLTWNYRTGVIEPLAIGVNNNLLHDQTGNFGPEAMIASELNRNSNGTAFILFKYAVAGTSMEGDWNSDKPDSLYDQLVASASYLGQVLAQKGQTACYRAFFWMQGESDLSDDRLPRYQGNFEKFKARIRLSFDALELPFFLGRVTSPPTREFDEAQDRIAQSDPRVRLVETNGLSKDSDDVHFDTLGQIELGRRFHESFRGMEWDVIRPSPRCGSAPTSASADH